MLFFLLIFLTGDFGLYGMKTSQRYIESKPAGKSTLSWQNIQMWSQPCVDLVLWWHCVFSQTYISSVCWHGVADTSCVREVPKSCWPSAWNIGQWGHWSWHFGIWQHRRWWLFACSSSACGMRCVTLFWRLLETTKSLFIIKAPRFWSLTESREQWCTTASPHTWPKHL